MGQTQTQKTWKDDPFNYILNVRVKDKHNFASCIYSFGSTVTAHRPVKKLTKVPYSRFIRMPLLYAKKHRAWHLLEFDEVDREDVERLLEEQMTVQQVQLFQMKQINARKKYGLKYGVDNSRLA